MIIRKSSYELSNSQIKTPINIIRTHWEITHKYRSQFDTVLDLGAGDGRYSNEGIYKKYEGIEIDESCNFIERPQNALIHFQCAFEHHKRNYSLCIGNPPYVRHHNLDQEWRDMITQNLSEKINITINRNANLYIYFILLGLLHTSENGLVSLLVPYEWASRPSASWLRKYIDNNSWHVDIYRFKANIFEDVMTTASISVIDKNKPDGLWNYFEIDSDGNTIKKPEVTTTSYKLIPFENRGEIWAMRGMSPGTQKVFTLTEGERIHAGLSKDDVLPCVTSLRNIPYNVNKLSVNNFNKYFVEKGVKCWLIKSHDYLSERVKKYLDNVPEEKRATWTCKTRNPWYKFSLHPCPKIISASAFINHGPKIVINEAGVYPLGSVCGIYYENNDKSINELVKYLKELDFEKQVVAHSDNLKKIEIRQFNSVLNKFTLRYGNVRPKRSC